jgi:hypothetical protein
MATLGTKRGALPVTTVTNKALAVRRTFTVNLLAGSNEGQSHVVRTSGTVWIFS